MDNDLLSQVREELNERMTNPLLFCLITAWAIHNYELFLIAFSSADIDYKLELFQSVIRKDFWMDSVVLPIIFGLFVFLLIPVLAYSKILWEIMKNHLNRKMLEVQNNGPVCKSVVDKILIDNRSLKSERDGANEKLESTSQELADKKKELKELELEFQDYKNGKRGFDISEFKNLSNKSVFIEAAEKSLNITKDQVDVLLKEYHRLQDQP